MTSGFTACATNENIFALSVSILTSSPLLSCHSGSASAEIWRHINFLTWRPRSLNTTSGFIFVDVLAFRRSKSINKPNFVINGQIIPFFGWDIMTSGLEKQTSTILEFYFRFQSRPFPRDLHLILHQPAKFSPIRSSHCENMTSYRFIKVAAPVSHLLIKLPSEGQSLSANQMSSIPIDGWDITTSVFEKQTSAILEFYFRFLPWPLPVMCMSFCITLPNFVQIGAPTAEIWRHIHFSRWRPRPLNITSGLVFVVTAFRMSKSISKPNFVDISQLSAEI